MHRHHHQHTQREGPSDREVEKRNREEDRLLQLWAQEGVRRLLNDSRPVRPTNRDAVKTQLAGLHLQLCQLFKKRLEPHTNELIASIAKAAALKTLLTYWLFPINNLPVELLQNIISFATKSQPFSQISRTRIRFASVCKHWRSAAIGMSSLWSVIRVTEQPPYPLTQISLQRAGTQLISICVDQRKPNWSGSEHDHRLQPGDMQSLMVYITKGFSQIRELAIFADTWAVITAAEQVLQRAPPPRSLQRLEIRRTGSAYVRFEPFASAPEGVRIPVRLFGGARAPALNHLTLNGVYADFRSSSFRNLRVLEMRKMATEQMPNMKDFYPVLEGSPYLEKLTFHCACPTLTGPEDYPNWEDAEVKLTYLRELALCDLLPFYAMFLVRLISAPNLERIRLERIHPDDEDVNQLITELCCRQRDKLTELVVYDLICNDVPMIASWIGRTSVRRLRVGKVPGAFFTALTRRMKAPPVSERDRQLGLRSVCPWLETCEVPTWDGISFLTFQMFCIERNESLRSLVIGQKVWDALREEEREWLAQSRTRRLHVVPQRFFEEKDEYE
ncbi:NAN1_2 [Sanghuangporus sanghuang]